LKSAYEAMIAGKPPQILQGYLVQGVEEPALWRAIAIWNSREAFDEYRKSVETPGGMVMFRLVGAEPQMTLFEVALQT
jgi:hypothetical protein